MTVFSLFNADNLQVEDEGGVWWNGSLSSPLLPVAHVRREGERHPLSQRHLSHAPFKSLDDLPSPEGEGERCSELPGGLDEGAVVQVKSVVGRHHLAGLREGLLVSWKVYKVQWILCSVS